MGVFDRLVVGSWVWIHVPIVEGWAERDYGFSQTDAVRRVIAHEFAHLVCRCPGHGDAWKKEEQALSFAFKGES